MYNYFVTNNLFYRQQAGFLPGHSTVFQQSDTYRSIVRSIDEDKSCMIFVISQKHLTAFGIAVFYSTYKPMEYLFSSYLCQRSQKVMNTDPSSSKAKYLLVYPMNRVMTASAFIIITK